MLEYIGREIVSVREKITTEGLEAREKGLGTVSIS